MRTSLIIALLLALASCKDDDISWIAIENVTALPIYASAYSSDYTEGDWIQPGVTDEFYSIANNWLDGFAYFSFYYDSLVIYIKDHEYPVRFYKDGRAENYDPTLNPFTNPEVWKTRSYKRYMDGSLTESLEEKQIFEHYFSIEAEKVKTLSDTIYQLLTPA
ncbi:MAG: hypothetical protein CSA96_06470 [Bacteroidetes bacterium]|nr:MAG: hypothetical protein CSA96_06470 [Bacteroidota bacterium]